MVRSEQGKFGQQHPGHDSPADKWVWARWECLLILWQDNEAFSGQYAVMRLYWLMINCNRVLRGDARDRTCLLSTPSCTKGQTDETRESFRCDIQLQSHFGNFPPFWWFSLRFQTFSKKENPLAPVTALTQVSFFHLHQKLKSHDRLCHSVLWFHIMEDL